MQSRSQIWRKKVRNRKCKSRVRTELPVATIQYGDLVITPSFPPSLLRNMIKDAYNSGRMHDVDELCRFWRDHYNQSLKSEKLSMLEFGIWKKK